MKKRMDDALRAFWKENLALDDFQGKAKAEVAYMIPTLDVSWPAIRAASPEDAIVIDALMAIDKTREPDATLEDAFQAGRAVQLVLWKWTERLKRGKRRKDTHIFYGVVDKHLAEGLRPKDAYKKANSWCNKNEPNAAIPTVAAFKTHRAERKGKE